MHTVPIWFPKHSEFSREANGVGTHRPAGSFGGLGFGKPVGAG